MSACFIDTNMTLFLLNKQENQLKSSLSSIWSLIFTTVFPHVLWPVTPICDMLLIYFPYGWIYSLFDWIHIFLDSVWMIIFRSQVTVLKEPEPNDPLKPLLGALGSFAGGGATGAPGSVQLSLKISLKICWVESWKVFVIHRKMNHWWPPTDAKIHNNCEVSVKEK